MTTHQDITSILSLAKLIAMSEEKNQPKPLKGLFSSISKLAVKHPKAKPGPYYKENQKQCLQHAVRLLSERLPHWGVGTIEQMVLLDMALERIAQRESRFSFMQEASTRTRKYAPFAPRDQGDIQLWTREFHKAAREYQRMVWVRSDLMRKRKIPTPEFWLFGSLYNGLKRSGYLREKCIERALSATAVSIIVEEMLVLSM